MIVAYYVNMMIIPLMVSMLYSYFLYGFNNENVVMKRQSFWTVLLILCGVEWSIELIFVFWGQRRTLQPNDWLYTPVMIVVDIMTAYILSKIIQRKEEKEVIVAKGKITIGKVIIVLIIGVGTFGYSLLRWYEYNFNVSFDALLYTIAMPTEGTADEMIWGAIAMIVPLWIFLFVICVSNIRYIWRKLSIDMNKRRKGSNVLVAGLCILCIAALIRKIGVIEYIISSSDYSQLYEDYYVEPSNEIMIREKEQRNLILIYLESMETTYCDGEHGGENIRNYIPNLTRLAEENISFSNGNEMGGAFSCVGTGWTMAATIATTSGVPFSFPVERNSMGENVKIASGLITLGELLSNDGYNLELIMGSDASFAGEGTYYQQHGGYKVFDYNDIVDKGYVSKGFREWWGVRDEIVYKAAKDEITNLTREKEPFAISLFTMDTHSSRGYVCPLCKEEDEEQLGNVLLCADRQINEFVDWCKRQPFFGNTTIVILGDHPRMDNYLVGGLQPEKRTTYNCIINGSLVCNNKTNNKDRRFTTLDYFPTIISALGYKIEGNRLGLGTNLFSNTKTLSEEFGLTWLNDELARKSKYYIENFY